MAINSKAVYFPAEAPERSGMRTSADCPGRGSSLGRRMGSWVKNQTVFIPLDAQQYEIPEQFRVTLGGDEQS